MSEQQEQKQKPRWYAEYWIVIFALTITIGFSLIIFEQVTFEVGISFLIAALIAECIAYYGRVKPSFTLNRIIYIMIGIPLGFVIWIAFWMVIMRQVYPQGADDLLIVILSIIGCYAIAFIIGDLIGKSRNYKGPDPYQI